MAKGNPNPSPATRFKPGQSGNPLGVSSTVHQTARANAEAAVRIRERMLRAIEAKLVELSTEQVMELVEPAMLKMLTDSETRGLGAPVQPVDHTSTDGTMSPKPNVIEFVAPQAIDESDD